MVKPLVSVLISVYNAGKFLRPSVKSILSQTYKNLEIIIIDDGSTDDCLDKIVDLEDPRIKILRQKNQGKSVALNKALDILSGEFYAIHDADDTSYPTRIERQLEQILDNLHLAAVFTGYDIILNGQHLAPRFVEKSIEQSRCDIEQMRMPSHDPTGMYRVEMVKEIKYNPKLKIGQGWDYILRVGEMFPMKVLGECLYSYRYHCTSNTRQDAHRRTKKIKDVLAIARERRGIKTERCWKSSTKKLSLHRNQEYGLVAHFMESVLDLRSAGRRKDAIKISLSCFKLHPYDPYYYKPLLYALTPLCVIKYYRSLKKY